MKKVLSFVLVLSLVLGSFGMAFATPSDVAGTSNQTAVDVLMALDVINGYPDGTFKPEKIVTRAEMAKILIAASGYGDLVNEAKSNFTDMAGHWADKYVAYAASLGLVNGYPDGTFKPNQTVSYAEAATMMVRALGYNDKALLGTWPANYVTKAMALNLFKNVSAKVGGANRGDIAEMTFELLDESMGKVDKDNIFQKSDPADNMLVRYGAELVTGQAIVPSDNDSTKSLIDLGDYVGQKVDYYKQKSDDKKIIAVTKVRSDVLKGEYDHPNTEVTVNDKDYAITGTATSFYVNSIANSSYDSIDDYNGKDVIIAGELSGKTMTVYSVNAWIPDVYQRAASSDVNDIQAVYDGDEKQLFGYDLPLDDDDKVDFNKFTLVGVNSLKDVKKDHVVAVFLNSDSKIAKIHVSTATAEGIATKKVSDTKIVVDGKEYKTSEGVKTGFNATSITLGSTIIAYIGIDGKIVDFKETKPAVADNYAVVLKVINGIDANDLPAKVRLLTQTGEIIKYEINSKADYVSSAGTKAKLLGVNGSGAVVLTGAATSEVTVGAIVKYETNSSGEISKIGYGDEASSSQTYNPRTNQLGGTDIASNVVIFKVDTANDDNCGIIKVEDLDKDASLAYWNVNNSDNNKVMAVAVAASNVPGSDKYAAIVKVSDVYDAELAKTVKEVQMLVEGEAKTYNTTKDFADTVNEDGMYKITIKEGRLSAVSSYTSRAAIKTAMRTLASINTDKTSVTVTGASAYTAELEPAADLAVYRATFDNDGAFDKWVKGTTSDLREGCRIAVYDNVDSDTEKKLSSGEDIYELVFVVKKTDWSKF